LEKPNSQLSHDPRSCHLGYHTKSIRHPRTLENVTQGELQRYENNYKALNLITTALSRNVYDHVSHLETAHDIWLKL
jgi:hypothetical protein